MAATSTRTLWLVVLALASSRRYCTGLLLALALARAAHRARRGIENRLPPGAPSGSCFSYSNAVCRRAILYACGNGALCCSVGSLISTLDKSPYRLYALSNTGSLLALLSYPFIVEPLFRLQVQSWIWSLAYVVFVVLCAACGWQLCRSRINEKKVAVNSEDGTKPQVNVENRPATGTALMWLSLSACGSGLLMATTNQMSIDIASVPFLWIVPLSLYLLTFILCFDSERWYYRPLFSALLPLVLINTLRLLYIGEDLEIVDQLLGYSLTLFVCCMCCHGELARLRPVPKQLTLFFLIVSAGGALGGMFVAILAPMIFTGFYEFHSLLIMCYLLVVLAQLPGIFSSEYDAGNGVLIRVLSAFCWAAVLCAIIFGAYYSFIPDTLVYL